MQYYGAIHVSDSHFDVDNQDRQNSLCVLLHWFLEAIIPTKTQNLPYYLSERHTRQAFHEHFS